MFGIFCLILQNGHRNLSRISGNWSKFKTCQNCNNVDAKGDKRFSNRLWLKSPDQEVLFCILGYTYFCYSFYGNSAAGASLSRLKHVKEREVVEFINESDIWGEFHCSYRHDALQQARIRFRWDLPLHWPFLHYRCDLGIIHIEDTEAGHVDATETIRLQVDGHQVLLGHNSNQSVAALRSPGWFLLTVEENNVGAD